MESVRGGAAVRGRIDQRIDDLQLLDDRARPAVRDDDRQRIRMLRTDVDEVDVQPVDLGDEVRQGVHPGLDLAPVVFRRPVARELLDRRELHALRKVGDGLLVGQARGGNASAKIIQLFVGRAVAEGADRGVAGSLARGLGDNGFFGCGGHGHFLCVVGRGEHKWADRKRGCRTGKKVAPSQRRGQSCLGGSTSRKDKLVASRRVLRFLESHGRILVWRKERSVARVRLDSIDTQCAEGITPDDMASRRLDDGIAQYLGMSRASRRIEWQDADGAHGRRGGGREDAWAHELNSPTFAHAIVTTKDLD